MFYKKLLLKFQSQTKPIKISIVLLGIIIIWFAIGLLIPRHVNIEKPTRGKGKVTALVREESEKEVYKVISGYGRVDRDMVQLVSEINSHVSRIYAKEGMEIRKGDPVIGLLNDVVIPSPLSGKLDTVDVIKGDVVFAGQTTLFSVISKDKLDVEMHIGANDAREVKPGNLVKIELENDVFEGKVYFVSKSSDKNTNTFKVKIKVNKGSGKTELFHGESVKINIYTMKKQGYFVPTSALSLGKNEEKIIKYLDDEKIVRESEIEILQTTSNGLWVSGKLPPKVIIIIRGGDFLKTGETTEYKFE
jgi:multidrug efflux pump subunit AcrA (membrane-fusion protein)